VEQVALDRLGGHAVRGPRFLVWDEDAREAKAWATELAESARPPRQAAYWRTVAAKSAAEPAMLDEAHEAEVASWIRTACAEGRVVPLGMLLCLLPSLDRTQLVSTWATSADEPTRRALALALSAPFEAVGVRTALEMLQRDPSPEIRRLARRAVVERRAVLG
jgi:hypothetical protein